MLTLPYIHVNYFNYFFVLHWLFRGWFFIPHFSSLFTSYRPQVTTLFFLKKALRVRSKSFKFRLVAFRLHFLTWSMWQILLFAFLLPIRLVVVLLESLLRSSKLVLRRNTEWSSPSWCKIHFFTFHCHSSPCVVRTFMETTSVRF